MNVSAASPVSPAVTPPVKTPEETALSLTREYVQLSRPERNGLQKTLSFDRAFRIILGAVRAGTHPRSDLYLALSDLTWAKVTLSGLSLRIALDRRKESGTDSARTGISNDSKYWSTSFEADTTDDKVKYWSTSFDMTDDASYPTPEQIAALDASSQQHVAYKDYVPIDMFDDASYPTVFE